MYSSATLHDGRLSEYALSLLSGFFHAAYWDAKKQDRAAALEQQFTLGANTLCVQ